MKRGLAGLMAAIMLLGEPSGAGASGSRSARDQTELQRSRALIMALNRHWMSDLGASTDWNGLNAWQRFVIVDALADYAALSFDTAPMAQIRQTVANRSGLDGNDDDLWAVIAALDVYRLDHDKALLDQGQRTFDRIVSDYWDQTCGGGLWWDHARTYKNAITTSLMAHASSLLYFATGRRAYRHWAQRGAAWLKASGMINGDGLLNDGLNKSCHNNGGPTFTYNQGVYLGALTNLYLITGERSYLTQAVAVASAATRRLSTPDGILREPGGALGQDGAIFKGVFVRHLGRLVRVMPAGAERRALARYLEHNADVVWRGRRDDLASAYWDDAAPPMIGAAPQGAAIDLMNAAAEADGAGGADNLGWSR